jgi:excisionase family DNA binding protein
LGQKPKGNGWSSVSSGYRTTKDEVTEEEDRLLTVVEAASFLSLSVGGLYHLVSQRRIPVVKLSARCIRFSRKALLGWIESMTHAVDSGDVHQKH